MVKDYIWDHNNNILNRLQKKQKEKYKINLILLNKVLNVQCK